MASVSWRQVLAWRMARQSLAPRTATSAADAVRRSAGIQAQVHSAAVIGVAQRRRSIRTLDVERALWRDRTVVKTWAMRGTLHLLAAEELPNVVATLRDLHPWTAASWQRYHGVTAKDVERVREAIGEVLGGRVLTREELGAEVAERVRSKRVGSRLGSGWGELLKPAAFAGLLIQGPPREGRVTYTRPDTWLKAWNEVTDPVDGGAALARSYLRAHGPATAGDLARWWVRQPPGKVKPWLRHLGDELVEVEVDGAGHLLLAQDLASLQRQRPNDDVRLLPAFDQYVLAAARDLEELVPQAHRAEVFRKINGWISATVVHRGRVVGTWSVAGGSVALDLWARVSKGPLAEEVARVERIVAAAGSIDDIGE